jgi:hypothetical protein
VSKTKFEGLDYGHGLTNIDRATGIRFGVIAQHTVGAVWWVAAVPEYGAAHCPRCATKLAESDGEEEGMYYCQHCRQALSADACFSGEPVGYNYASGAYVADGHISEGYKLTDCLDTEIMVLASPYYTRAQFCSPCCPGAGNLDHPCDTGPKTYCLGHEWFEGGVAPYDVYSVTTKQIVTPKIKCQNQLK